MRLNNDFSDGSISSKFWTVSHRIQNKNTAIKRMRIDKLRSERRRNMYKLLQYDLRFDTKFATSHRWQMRSFEMMINKQLNTETE